MQFLVLYGMTLFIHFKSISLHGLIHFTLTFYIRILYLKSLKKYTRNCLGQVGNAVILV